MTNLFLIFGVLLMLFVNIVRAKKYNYKVSFSILTTLVLTIFGLIGVKLLYFIENNYYGGNSFFGALFFTPIFMIFYFIIFKKNIKQGLNYIALPISLMLFSMKICCYIGGCCYGKFFSWYGNGNIRFPIQLIESCASLCIAVTLYAIEFKNKHVLYSYFIIYAISRFGFEFFRETNKIIFGLSRGQINSLLLLLITLILILLETIKKTKDAKNRT